MNSAHKTQPPPPRTPPPHGQRADERQLSPNKPSIKRALASTHTQHRMHKRGQCRWRRDTRPAAGCHSSRAKRAYLLLLRLLRGWVTVLAVLRDKLSLPPRCARSLYKLYRSRFFALNRSDRAVKSVSQICKIRSLELLRGWGRGAVNFFARGGQPTNPRPCTKAAAG